MPDDPKTSEGSQRTPKIAPDFSVVIVAGGAGERMKANTKKAFMELAGDPMVLHSARVFGAMPEVGQLIVVMPGPELVNETGESDEVVSIESPPKKATTLVRSLMRAGVTRLVAGGPRRQDSVLNGLRATDPALPFVMIHDAARPFVAPGDLKAVAAKTRECGAAMLAHPVRDTVKRVSGDTIRETIDRTPLWAAQTPQCFRREVLLQAFERHGRKDVTDDAALAALDGVQCHVVQGSAQNFKITTPEDMELAEALLRSRNASATFKRLPDSETIFDLGPRG
jgi:2-C-methyl-D-erythritol 4-phosphate cytidylyltransferase